MGNDKSGRGIRKKPKKKNIGFQLKTRFSRPDPENADKMDSFVTDRIGRACTKKCHPSGHVFGIINSLFQLFAAGTCPFSAAFDSRLIYCRVGNFTTCTHTRARARNNTIIYIVGEKRENKNILQRPSSFRRGKQTEKYVARAPDYFTRIKTCTCKNVERIRGL